MFPGYVLIHMIMNDDTWYVVQKHQRRDRFRRTGIQAGAAQQRMK